MPNMFTTPKPTEASILIIDHRKCERYIKATNRQAAFQKAFEILREEGFITEKSCVSRQIEKYQSVIDQLNLMLSTGNVSLDNQESRHLVEEINKEKYSFPEACSRVIKRYQKLLRDEKDEFSLLERIENNDRKAAIIYVQWLFGEFIREAELIIPDET